MPRVLLGSLAVVAVAGWALAVYFLNQSKDLDVKLSAGAADRAKLAEELDSARGDLDQYRESAGRLEEIDEKVSAAEKRVAALDEQLLTAGKELATATKESDARRSELAAIEARLGDREAEAAVLEGKIEKAGNQLASLRAEADELRRKTAPLQADLAGAQAAAPAESVTTLPAKSDMAAEAKRRFQAVDQNGDGKLDELEFRFNSVKLLDLVDANADGSITVEETLLSAEAFQLLESDGDGKISAIEFSDANTFRQFDTKNQGFITFEDLLALIRAPKQ